ncbi:hypothetical protein CTEN210_04978 [Chaetoceros tenuissimus]|uniref:Uncharacterized protein n=1 Tax=Chaetoceros tenuissimus TaxID=426638 RepID=A0AAD3CM27_9STRA|nr:hypothetical protein CTEN210_04978 [Chaetoceros tenuissimus]
MKFKGNEYQQIPAHIEPHDKDDTDAAEMRAKLDQMRLARAAASNNKNEDAAALSNKNESEVGSYKLDGPTKERQEEIKKNNKNFQALGQPFYEKFKGKGKVEAIQVERFYKNLSKVLIRKKVKDQDFTQFEDVEEMIREFGLPEIQCTTNDATMYNKYRTILGSGFDKLSVHPLMESVDGSKLYCLRFASNPHNVSVPFEIPNQLVDMVDICDMNGKLLERTNTRNECSEFILKNAKKKLRYDNVSDLTKSSLTGLIKRRRNNNPGKVSDEPIGFPPCKGKAEFLLTVYPKDYVRPVSSADDSKQPVQANTNSKLPAYFAAADSKLPAKDAAADSKLPAKDAATDSKLPAKDAAADSKLPAKDAATDSKLPAKDAAADSKLPAKDAAADSKLPADETSVIELSSDEESNGKDGIDKGAIQHSDVDSFDEENWEEEEEEFNEEEFCGDESESSASSKHDADSDY